LIWALPQACALCAQGLLPDAEVASVPNKAHDRAPVLNRIWIDCGTPWGFFMPQCALTNEASISCFRLGEHLFRTPRVLMMGRAITERADQSDPVGLADCGLNA